MRVAFLDPLNWQYSVETPYERPMGGSHSALCYLAVELAHLGQNVTLFNGNATPSASHGVELRNISETIAPGALNQFDVVVVLNSAIGRMLRRDARVSVPLVCWIGHNYDQPAVRALSRLNERKSWTSFAFVSEWQRGEFERSFWIPREKTRVMRNAMSPAFANRVPAAPWVSTGEPPELFYSSTPFRGLDVLLQAFPAIRAAIPGTRLRIFSSMAVYQVGAENDAFRVLYQRARTLEGVEYIGSIGQQRLADETAGAAALAYPSTFAETSCITVIEAMAMGAAVLTTRLGALPETTGGHAAMIDWEPDKVALTEKFAAMSIATLRNMLQRPDAAAASRDARIKFANDHYTWPTRAKEWVEWLTQIVATKTRTPSLSP